MHTNAPLQTRAWRVVSGAVWGIAVVLGLSALALALGAADPPRAEPLVWRDATMRWAHGAERWPRAPQMANAPAADFTLSVRARWTATADAAAAWGVWLEQTDGARLVFGVAAGGYWTVRRCPQEHIARLEACPAPRAEWRWQAHPRIRGAGAQNTLTLTREPDGRVRLWLNGERLAAPSVRWTGRWGVWARGEALAWAGAEGRGTAFLGTGAAVEDHAADDQHQPPPSTQ